jgi:hypothetical protein
MRWWGGGSGYCDGGKIKKKIYNVSDKSTSGDGYNSGKINVVKLMIIILIILIILMIINGYRIMVVVLVLIVMKL